MNVQAIKTHPITAKDTNILDVIDGYVTTLEEGSIVAVTSKIVSICEGRLVKIGSIDKDELIKQEAEQYLPRSLSKYNFLLTVKFNLLVPSAGIDESNANGFYVLWPKNPQETANQIREHLSRKFNLKQVGVIITDSRTTPLRWGVTGTAIAHSGFTALNDLRGKNDIFGRELRVTQVNVMDALAAASVFEMGEGAEQTPLAVITDLNKVEFQDRNPTQEELDFLKIDIEDDLYAPLLKSVEWKKD
jgi:putative folate metabolism gamma-glutamate ligase